MSRRCKGRGKAMFVVAALALMVTKLLTLIRLFAGPSLYDRALAVNSFGTKTVLLIGVMGFPMKLISA